MDPLTDGRTEGYRYGFRSSSQQSVIGELKSVQIITFPNFFIMSASCEHFFTPLLKTICPYTGHPVKTIHPYSIHYCSACPQVNYFILHESFLGITCTLNKTIHMILINYERQLENGFKGFSIALYHVQILNTEDYVQARTRHSDR